MRRLTGVYRGMYGKPVFWHRFKVTSSPGNLIASLFSGYTPVVLNPARMFFGVMDFNQASLKTSEKIVLGNDHPRIFNQIIVDCFSSSNF